MKAMHFEGQWSFNRNYLNLSNFFLNTEDRIFARLGRLDQEIIIQFSLSSCELVNIEQCAIKGKIAVPRSPIIQVNLFSWGQEGSLTAHVKVLGYDITTL